MVCEYKIEFFGGISLVVSKRRLEMRVIRTYGLYNDFLPFWVLSGSLLGLREVCYLVFIK